MNLKRVLTGLIGFPIVVAVLLFGNKYIVDAVFAIITLISMYEYTNAISNKYKPVKFVGYFLAISIAFIHIIPLEHMLKILIMLIPTVIAILFIKVIISKMDTNFNDIAVEFFGIVYIIGFMVFMPILYGMPNGKYLIMYVLLSAWGSDTFAYAAGRRFGKHKLSIISPKKSVEGSIAGVIGATLICLIYTICINKFVSLNINYIYIMFVSIVLSVLSQLGDLAASSIKRYVDVKDFGNLLPGHGGMIDRIDSIIFIAPFAYFLLSLI